MKFGCIYFLVVAFLAASGSGETFSAEEAVRTPSDQMKEALQKLGTAPAAIGQSLEDLTETAKDKLRSTFGGKSSGAKAEPVDLDVPKKAPPRRAESVDLLKTRDPFRPPTLQKEIQPRRRENLSPLERLNLSQLKLVGIVWGIKEPRAMVEDPSGLGYVIKVGTPIGSNDGKVKAIHRNEVVVEETRVDVTGSRGKRDVRIRLASE